MKNRTKAWFYPILIISVLLVLENRCKKDDNNNGNPPVTGTVTDIDGNTYRTIKIGTQVWMAENLKTTKYRDGDTIPQVKDGGAWSVDTTGAYCNWNNDINVVPEYGRLYNWYACTNPHKLAPEGWHIPSVSEWGVLIVFLGGDSIAGGSMKDTDTTHWASLNIGATNSSGFTAIAASARASNGPFFGPNLFAAFWTSLSSNNYLAYKYYIINNSAYIYKEDEYKQQGHNVRCIKD